jgi:hypothetical protein
MCGSGVGLARGPGAWALVSSVVDGGEIEAVPSLRSLRSSG